MPWLNVCNRRCLNCKLRSDEMHYNTLFIVSNHKLYICYMPPQFPIESICRLEQHLFSWYIYLTNILMVVAYLLVYWNSRGKTIKITSNVYCVFSSSDPPFTLVKFGATTSATKYVVNQPNCTDGKFSHDA